MPIQTDALVIGCGIAGAAAALRLAKDSQRQVLLVTRSSKPEECNTHYAQGGIVAKGVEDSAELLIQDVLAAGAGASREAAVRVLAQDGPELVRSVLIEEAGVQFDCKENGDLSYTREGRHSTDRILHAGDTTGRAIEKALLNRIEALPNITVKTNQTAIDFITSSHHIRDPLVQYDPTTCHGAYVLDRQTGAVHRVLASATVLAAGGLGRIYRYSTNPEGARGDGIAMAYQAGARILNAEYIQFHPTTLAVDGADNFLISEAVRGEGAKLFTPDGRHFMDEYAPKWGDLAPRDEVARAIQNEMIAHGYPHVLLDAANHIDKQLIPKRFPNIYAKCLEAGIDITQQPIPVVPAAHYSCGGVLVDSWGRTTIEKLYAVGEVSCTGVHGANRLASTSLLEGLVWGDRAACDIANRGDLSRIDEERVPPWQDAADREDPDPVLISRDRRTIQNIMWLYVGLARSPRRLTRALRDLNHLWEVIDGFYRTSAVNDDIIGLRNMAQAARIVVRAALRNRQSRGAHFRQDAKGDEFASFFDTGSPLPEAGGEF